MKRRGLQLSRRHKATLYVISLLLLFSGALWAWFHHLDEIGKSGEFLRSLNPWLMKIHGFAAVGFVLLLGTLLPVHVRHSWHANKNRTNGVFFLAVIGLLSLSGYSLYYLGDERVRGVCSNFHLWLGVLSPVLLVAHICFGRRATSK